MNETAPATRPGIIIATLSLAGIVAALMQTLVVPLIGDLPTILNTAATNTTWVITITLLTASIAIPVAGRLGDMYGKKRLLLASTVPLAVGSIVCALSTSLIPMIVGRGLEGLGMGIVPLGISLLRDVLPAKRVGSAIALMSASMGVGGALGLPFAAAIAQSGSWRVLFWVVAALSVLVAIAIAAFVPAGDAPAKPGRFDAVGAVGLGIGLVALMLAISRGSDWGWGSATTVSLFAGSAVVLLVWGWWEVRTTDPLVDLRVTARPQVLMTNLASLLVGFAMYAQSLVVPQLLQIPVETGFGLGQSMIAMGLWMAPAGLMMMAVAPVGAKLSAARGAKTTLALGALVIAIGYASSTLLLGSTVRVLVMTLIINSGVGLAYGAMPSLIMSAVPLNETASANGFNSLMRSIGSSTAAAIMGMILASRTISFSGMTLPSEAGFHIALMIGCGVALTAAIVAFFIPMRRTVSPSTAATPADTDAPDEGLVPALVAS
ncbi:Major Facilitator Superfamily protein [Sanguibacter gelidistatuariae]|uniref:Major Facilitator Superfamily protein n=1 Tax=Sanguibacter gelidistatuariae TaxID=1814289 RepID=A0A1G6GZW9_9MICO|nr:MFS transporter [Sanguibacter gelidistatuariae]SDB87225.1 Major Facilitator Superfamily protein [Sanguibacter gelidistatuariae]